MLVAKFKGKKKVEGSERDIQSQELGLIEKYGWKAIKGAKAKANDADATDDDDGDDDDVEKVTTPPTVNDLVNGTGGNK